MLSYRHMFHAGSPADVLKHAVLAHIASYLQRKAAGICFVDSHAGAGWYRLDSPQAQKTAEASAGICRVLDRAAEAPAVPDLLTPYLQQVQRLTGAGRRRYPGSAALLADLMRPQDRALLFELHPTDAGLLAATFRRDTRIEVRCEDSLAALPRQLPPPERRGLVLIDPSYEIKSDFADVPAMLLRAHRRFPSGVYVLWYPVIRRSDTDALIASVSASGMRKILRIELCLAPDSDQRGMTGSGLIVINPPFTLEPACAEALPWLAAALGAIGPHAVAWTVPE